jgi:hypothetical protein
MVGLVVAGVAVLEVWPHPPTWLGGAREGVVTVVHWARAHWLTSGALGVVVAPAAWLSPTLQQRHQRRQQAQAAQAGQVALLAANCLAVDEHTGQLPRVGQVRPVELGVHPAAELGTLSAGVGGLDLPGQVPVYVPRDKDAEVDAALTRGGLVLLVGDPTAGKSRAAYEAVRRLSDNRLLLVPLHRGSLRRLLDGGVRFGAVVVWLDDLERYLGGTDGLDVGLLRRLVGDGSHGVVVVAVNRDPEQACSVAREALTIAANTGSARAITELRRAAGRLSAIESKASPLWMPNGRTPTTGRRSISPKNNGSGLLGLPPKPGSKARPSLPVMSSATR